MQLPSEQLSAPVLQTEPGFYILSLSTGQLLVFPAETSPFDYPVAQQKHGCYLKLTSIL